MIGVQSGDSGGISVTGETPQERGFRDEEAHRTPHGTRPLGTEINIFYLALIKMEYLTIQEENPYAKNSTHKNLTQSYWKVPRFPC
ncbi:hypothetical protein BI350_00090 [Sporosarcina ureilytica]|uniref:Uncharacterized protein n=1 Tax=Sporosarcina ureilytica TaxID=298596 RepID=A0A1D8JBV8_9BACL|nr:hypothetical protein BI350_00090 [Sporosarcina ureilytica]